MRKRILVVAALATALTGAIAGTAGAQSGPSVNFSLSSRLTCFDGTTDGGFYGLCSTKAGYAVLDNVTNDATGATNPSDQYSGVYVKNNSVVGKAIGAVKALGFSYIGTPTAGSPRISLGIDTNGGGAWDDFAFISAAQCNDGARTVDAIHDPTCTINLGSHTYDNWAALVAAHPEYRVGYTPFVIADDPGVWKLFNVNLGQGLLVGRNG